MSKKTSTSWLWRILGAAAIYVLLLWLLVAAESSSADASIKSIADALWYSLVTLRYPVYVHFHLLAFGDEERNGGIRHSGENTGICCGNRDTGIECAVRFYSYPVHLMYASHRIVVIDKYFLSHLRPRSI